MIPVRPNSALNNNFKITKGFATEYIVSASGGAGYKGDRPDEMADTQSKNRKHVLSEYDAKGEIMGAAVKNNPAIL